MIHTILWDIDGTLLDFETASRRALESCFERFGFGYFTEDMFREYCAVNDWYWQQLEAGRMEKKRILVERFETYFAKKGLDASRAPDFDAAYRIAMGDNVRFCVNARETVEALRGRVRQYGVTNGTCELQHKKLMVSGLDELLDDTFISEEVVYEKPDVRFFEIAFAKMGIAPSRDVLIVGDSQTSDMLGGVNADISTCYYNPKRKTIKQGLRIDHEITDIAGVLRIVENAT